MSTSTNITTADQLFRMPDDGARYELVDGDLIMMSPSGSEHGMIIGQFSWMLSNYVRIHDLGVLFGAETGFLISRDPDTVLAPDIAFIRRERLEKTGVPKTYHPEAPSLVVEVVSPNDKAEEVDIKMRRWLEAGVELAWVVHPAARSVTVYRSPHDIVVLTEDKTLDGGDLLPGFTCQIAEIFVR